MYFSLLLFLLSLPIPLSTRTLARSHGSTTEGGHGGPKKPRKKLKVSVHFVDSI
jgi:hypothetical protein